ncbi:amino acid/amide ABC transporter ATP-binding protein 1, HAAT family [Limimonas halophila]|uniref:Amino acid/amide ABC transporter ATP-binding protein 1, HAAT family n=1 Tax=Limimonas halophila TaxID=1082479 RepID=A0A1G7NDU2_9PROT|nr:ABC transporter ATP-binding protein [Limimonas halophila]SDF72203.1 amino acid/amide ABC transporter ATP-binding protein 1, HAAT family [Limimonas halophila]
MSEQALLRVDDIHKRFGGLTALDGVSMEVHAGRVFGLIGPNGSGKTTLFNVITGFAQPDDGQVVFDGERIDGLSPDKVSRKGLCRTFQASLNPQHMTVMENMLLAPQNQVGENILSTVLRIGRIREQEEESLDRAWDILKLVKLDHQVDTPAGSLSGGQKKLLMLGQALMLRPKLILLDEPVAGVNPRLIEDIVEVIRKLQRQGQNFLIIEHNMQVVRQLCDTIHVLDAGRVLASGATRETLQREEVLKAYLGRRTREEAGA